MFDRIMGATVKLKALSMCVKIVPGNSHEK